MVRDMVSKYSVGYAVRFIIAPVLLLLLAAFLVLESGSGGSPRHSISSLQSLESSTDHQIYCPLIFMDWSPPIPLLISEVLFNAFGEEPDGEWIELYNYGRTELNLQDFKIGDAETLGDFEGMYLFPLGAKIESGDVMIIANQSLDFEVKYGFKPDFEVNNTDLTVPDLEKDPNSAHGSLSLRNSGDEVILISLLDSIIDMVSWGDSIFAFSPSVPNVLEGQTIERYPPHLDTNTASDWRVQDAPSPGLVDLTPPPTRTPLPVTPTSTTANTDTATPTNTIPPTLTSTATPSPTSTRTNTATPTLTASSTSTSTSTPTSTYTPTITVTPSPAEHLLISEVLYDPFFLEPQYEWIEIYNPTQGSLVLDDYKVGDEESSGGNEGMLIFPPGYNILPAERLVIANNGASFSFYYGYPPDFEMEDSDPNIPDMAVYYPWANGNIHLDNIGDEVLLIGVGDILIDAMSWGTSNFAFDPPCPDVPEGHSLERYPEYIDTDTADDWIDEDIPTPGLP